MFTEDTEFIEVMTVPVNDLMTVLKGLCSTSILYTAYFMYNVVAESCVALHQLCRDRVCIFIL